MNIHSRIVSIFVLCFLAGVPVACVENNRSGTPANGSQAGTVVHGTLETVKATWRLPGLGDTDATEVIRGKVEDRRINAKIGWSELNMPHREGAVATLIVIYKINGKLDATSVRGGGNMLTLEAPRP